MDVYKVVVLGNDAISKTTFALQCVVEILDTVGQEEYSVFREMWIRQSEAFIVMYSVTSSASEVQ
ncbi:hypothetical protein AFLA70_79g003611 [Aspergillus flavus AF70]|nr:hypothetical protein AFLA70_79g003611 [Aspergillus flavus AF70]